MKVWLSGGAAVAVAAGAVAGLSIAGRSGGADESATYGDSGNCIGRWSQPYNESAWNAVARAGERAGAAERYVGITVVRARCRVAVAFGDGDAHPALVFDQARDGNTFDLRGRVRVGDLPSALRRWVTRADANGILIGHP